MGLFDDGEPKIAVIFTIFIIAGFALFTAAFLFAILRGIWRWGRNSASPLMAVPAVVVGKRGHVSGGSGDTSASTSYYVTFEEQGGERREMHLSGSQFGVLLEGDRGELKYQGTRYKGFDRTPQDR